MQQMTLTFATGNGSTTLRYELKEVVFSGVPRNFVRGGVQQIQLRKEDRENGDLGSVAP